MITQIRNPGRKNKAIITPETRMYTFLITLYPTDVIIRHANYFDKYLITGVHGHLFLMNVVREWLN